MKAQRLVATLLMGATIVAGTEAFAGIESPAVTTSTNTVTYYQNQDAAKAKVRRHARRHVRRHHRRAAAATK